MARIKQTRLPAEQNYYHLWQHEYKPAILSFYQVPLDVVAKALGVSVNTVQEQLRSGHYGYGIARPCSGGSYRYEVMPLRLIAFIEGHLRT